MFVLVTGSRTWNDREAIRRRLEAITEPYRLLHGGAPGVDTICGEVYEELTGQKAIVERPDYKANFYKAAPKIRNLKMVDMAEAEVRKGEEVLVLSFKDLNSTTGGTNHCTEAAKARGLNVEEIREFAS